MDKPGEMGRFQHGVPCTWRLPCLAVEWPWSALAGHLVGTKGCRNNSFPLMGGTISGTIGSFQSGGVFVGQSILTIESSLTSGCSKVHKPLQNVSKKLWLNFPVLVAPSKNGNTDQGRYP